MTTWLDEGQKFALLGLQVGLDPNLRDGLVAEGLEAYSGLRLDLPGHWREWLGTTQVEEIETSTLVLVCRAPSVSPTVRDAESALLRDKVGRWLTGLMLECPLESAREPFSALGSMHEGELDFREYGTLRRPHNSIIHIDIEIGQQQLEGAAKVAAVIQHLMQTPGPHLWRLFRCLSIYQEARALADPMERIHQFTRCIEGLLATTTGNTRNQFKSRTERFVGPRYHNILGTIYDIRSEVEHLHEDRRLEPFDREKRLEIAKLEVLVAELARHILRRILSGVDLSRRFGSRASLEQFWALDKTEQQTIWGPIYDPMTPLRGIREDYISNVALGQDLG